MGSRRGEQVPAALGPPPWRPPPRCLALPPGEPDWHTGPEKRRGSRARASPRAPGRRAPGARSGKGPAIPQGLGNRDRAGHPRGRGQRHPGPFRPRQRRAQDIGKEKDPLSLNGFNFRGIFSKATPRNLFPFSTFPFHPLFLRPRDFFFFFFFKQSI